MTASLIFSDKALTEEIGRGIMRVRRRIITEAARRLETQGQSVLAWQALNYLDRVGSPLPQVALAEGLGQHAPGISRLIDELERARLVRRSRNRMDRRMVLVTLARRGKTALEAGRPLVDSAVEEVLAPLDATDRRALRNLLWRMLPQK